MNIALRKPPRLTVADFIEMIRPYPDEERWELLDGFPILMSPQSERHQRIVANLLWRLDPLTRPRGCRVLPGLGVLNDAVDDYAPIPDVIVRCGPMLEGGYARDPVLVAEMLSPSTMSNDLGRKLEFYQTVATLRTILIVYQDEVRVEAWQRDATEAWQRRVLRQRSETLALPEFEGTLTLADLYEDVPLAS